ncbi:MAG: hypothetical protein L3J31_06380 [Bacteroidales bacterium]|nr:hypothetical protein [Bacteroidales bacterium]
MNKSILSSFIFLITLSILSVTAQEKPISYWVTTDAGDQMEVFPGNSPPNQDGSRTSGMLSTLFAADNGGSIGGAVYFDITVGPNDIEITDLDINSNETGAITLSVYTLTGSHVGNENNAGAWGSPVATGTGTGLGLDIPSNINLNTSVVLSANTTYGIALVLDANHGHDYTNGDGSNQNYSNADLSLSLGSASNTPFANTIFSPRVWNGTIYYTLTNQVPISNWAIVFGVLLIGTFIVIRSRRRRIA